MPNQQIWDRRWLGIVNEVSKWSKDSSTKVGAAIVSPDNRISSKGYNAMPRGLNETADKWQRPLKYLIVLHAQINSLLNSPFDTFGYTLYCTHTPCLSCMSALINAGIKRIVYINSYNDLQNNSIWQQMSALFDQVIQIQQEN